MRSGRRCHRRFIAAILFLYAEIACGWALDDGVAEVAAKVEERIFALFGYGRQIRLNHHALPGDRIGNAFAKRQPECPVGTARNRRFDHERVDSKIGAGMGKHGDIQRVGY